MDMGTGMDTSAEVALEALAAEVDQLTAEVVALAEDVDRVFGNEKGEVMP